MDYSEFKRHLGKAGLSVNEFSSLIQVRPSSISNYAKKSSVPHTYAVAAVLLGDAVDRGINVRDVLSRYGIQLQLPKIGSRVTNIDDFRKRSSHQPKPKK